MNLPKGVFRFFPEHRLLTRIALRLYTALLIPLLLLSVFLLKTEARSAYSAHELQLTTAAQSILSGFDEDLQTVGKFLYKVRSQCGLLTSGAVESVADELDALQTFKDLSLQLPFAEVCFLYSGREPDAVYLSSGYKYELDVYAAEVLHSSRKTLTDFLHDGLSRSQFSSWGAFGEKILYSRPVGGSAADGGCIVVVAMSRASLLERFRFQLGEQYVVAQMQDANGKIIYQSDALPFSVETLSADGVSVQKIDGHRCLIYSAASPQSVRIALYCASDGIYAVHRLTMLVIGLCALLSFAMLALTIWQNIAPFQTFLTNIGYKLNGFHTISDELTALSDMFLQTHSQAESLREQVREQLYQGLINGDGAPTTDAELLAENDAFFLIVVSEDALSPAIADALAAAGFQCILKKRFGVLLCPMTDPFREDLHRLSESIHSRFFPDARIGVSNLHARIERMHVAYIEATTAFGSLTDAPVAYAENLSFSSNILIHNTSADLAQLVHSLKSRGDGVLDRIDRDFALVEYADAPESEKRFICFRIVDFYRKAAEKAGVLLNLHPLYEALGSGTVQEIRNVLSCTIHHFYETEQNGSEPPVDSLPMKILNYIDGHFCDDQLDIAAIAEYFDISPSKVSLILKNDLQIGFRQYIRSKRMEHAKELLRSTDMSIAAIAEQVGFTSASYFISTFKAHEKTTPSAYREQNLHLRA